MASQVYEALEKKFLPWKFWVLRFIGKISVIPFKENIKKKYNFYNVFEES